MALGCGFLLGIIWVGFWTVGVRGPLLEFDMHAKNIDSNRQHDSSPNTGDQYFRPYPEPRAQYTPTRCDFFPSLPTELLLCIITQGGLVQNDYGWLNAFVESFRRERGEAGVWEAFPD